MAEKQVEVVAVIKRINPVLIFCFFLGPFFGMAQQENSGGYKKRVLESAEVDILSSYYNQDGNNASVTGGIGSEALMTWHPPLL